MFYQASAWPYQREMRFEEGSYIAAFLLPSNRREAISCYLKKRPPLDRLDKGRGKNAAQSDRATGCMDSFTA